MSRRSRLSALLIALLGVALCSLPAMASPVVTGYSLIDLSNGTYAAGSGQTVWNVADGTVVRVNQPHWSNGSLYYIGYVFDNSFTYDPVTGAYNNTNPNAAHGYLSSGSDTAIITVTFPEARDISMMRLYPAGYVGVGNAQAYVTDYSIDYQDAQGVWHQAVSRQTVTPSQVPSGVDSRTLFTDQLINVTAQTWRVNLFNGEGGWENNATFGEVQFFASVPEPSAVLLLVPLGAALLIRRRRCAA
jgi:hypothetical protein